VGRRFGARRTTSAGPTRALQRYVSPQTQLRTRPSVGAERPADTASRSVSIDDAHDTLSLATVPS